MATALDNAISELNRRTQILSKFQRRMPDPDTRLFVYGLNETQGVLTSQDGSTITSYEDPTFLGFNMEIESSESPLFSQVPCYLKKYGLHPELRDRHELYNLFVINLYNYIPLINSDINSAVSLDTTNPIKSRGKQILESILNPLTANALADTQKSTFNKEGFVKGAGDNTDSWISEDKLGILVDDFYDPNLKQNLKNRISLKRHYIKKLDGLINGRFIGDKEGELTIDIAEDIGLHSEMLGYCYENSVWSQRSQRELIPENLLEFTLKVYVYEIRNIREFKTALQVANSVIGSLINPSTIANRIGDLVGNTNYVSDVKNNDIQTREKAAVENVLKILTRCFSMTRYTLHNCRFDFSEGGSVPSSISNENQSGNGISSSFKIKYRRVYKEYFSRLTPKWTSDKLELYWFDNYKSSPVVPVTSASKRTVTIPANSSTRITDLVSQSGRELQTAANMAIGNLNYNVMDDLNIKPIVPANIYRPGSYLDNVINQLESAVGSDIKNQLLKGIFN